MPKKRDETRLLKALMFIDTFYRSNSKAPTLDEMKISLGTCKTNVKDIIEKLVEAGYLTNNEYEARSLKITKLGRQFMYQMSAEKPITLVAHKMVDVATIPIIGPIVASAPIPIPSVDGNYFDSESTIDILCSELGHVKNVNNLFALEVRGDSMIDALINDGDIVVFQPVSEVKNGDMVAAWLRDDEGNQLTTLKKYFREGNRVRLQPANKTMDPIFVNHLDRLEIKGKVVKVIPQAAY